MTRVSNRRLWPTRQTSSPSTCGVDHPESASLDTSAASAEGVSRHHLIGPATPYNLYVVAEQQARVLFTKYRNIAPGPPPIVRELPESELFADFRKTARIAALLDHKQSREMQIVGNVIRGWLGHELRSRHFAREFPQLFSS